MKKLLSLIMLLFFMSSYALGQNLKVYINGGMDAYLLVEVDSITFNVLAGTVTDIDGNAYTTMQIGNQSWMTQNLKVTHYRNGDVIPLVADSSAWTGLSSGAYCNYNNNYINVDPYGRLYNWFAVEDSRNIAPEGWHVPTDDDWKELEMYLGMSQAQADSGGWRGTDQGGQLKEAGTAHWNEPNTGATNSSRFNARPGGYRHFWRCIYYSMGSFGSWWTATEYSGSDALYRMMGLTSPQVASFEHAKRTGYSVRCVKD